ncbi:hypothetical protein T492DRAFT_879623 [Pavlovales sp. CCMP2436]|nr:hypothetical protein T492DRAFT_879623 [Pavlovales sp. CCMP2436]
MQVLLFIKKDEASIYWQQVLKYTKNPGDGFTAAVVPYVDSTHDSQMPTEVVGPRKNQIEEQMAKWVPPCYVPDEYALATNGQSGRLTTSMQQTLHGAWALPAAARSSSVPSNTTAVAAPSISGAAAGPSGSSGAAGRAASVAGSRAVGGAGPSSAGRAVGGAESSGMDGAPEPKRTRFQKARDLPLLKRYLDAVFAALPPIKRPKKYVDVGCKVRQAAVPVVWPGGVWNKASDNSIKRALGLLDKAAAADAAAGKPLHSPFNTPVPLAGTVESPRWGDTQPAPPTPTPEKLRSRRLQLEDVSLFV